MIPTQGLISLDITPRKSYRLMVMLFKCICRRLVLLYAHTSGCDMGSALIHLDGRYTGDNVIL